MHILLPPSETKRTGGRGRPVAGRTSWGPLAETRGALLDALDRLLARGETAAAEALLLPPGVAAAALAANAAVTRSGTMPALRRYTGVVYDALGYATLTAAAQRLASRSILIFSGLWGVVRGDESVPDYRVPAKATLPGVGTAGRAWRPALAAALPTMLGDGPVVDLRSSDYASMWRPARDCAAALVSVRVLSPLTASGGAQRYGVVSFFSKRGKGILARALLEASARGATPRTIDDVAAVWLAAGGRDARPVGSQGVDLFT